MNGQSLWMRRQSGFGLIELMVAMAIGLLMLLGILTMFTWVSQARVALDKTSEQLENGRYVTQLLSDEVQMAGFYGVPQIAAEVFTNPTPCATALADLQFGFIVNKNTKPVPVYGYSAGSTLPACLSSALAGSEALVVRRVATTPIPVASVGSGSAGMYVQASSCSSDTQILNTSKTAADFSGVSPKPLLRQKDCATSVTSVWPYLSRTYFLSAPSGVPTLSVAELDNSGIRIIPLAEGVEDMHLSYGLDFDADGSPDCFADDLAGAQPAQCPSWAGSELDKWSNVTAVSIRFLVRSTETFRGWTDTRTYDLGRAAASGPFNDAYKRQVFSVAIPLPNVGGPRE
jgi:type IV pilus assembly protein PilW